MPVVAPALGADTEFDEFDERISSALEEIGNPEGITPEVRREKYAAAMSKYGGKTYASAPEFDIKQKPEVVARPFEEVGLAIPSAGEPYWYEKAADAALIEHFILARRALGAAFLGGLLVSGPAGTGKTLGVSHAIRRINDKHQLGLRLMKMDCATVTDPQKWFGRREADEKGTHYFPSDLVLAVQQGDVILLDDLSRIHPTIANGIFGFLDGSQSVHLSDLGVTIEVHPETIFIATMNQGSQYGGTFRLDWAWRERFPYTIERTFPPRDEEVRILTSATGVDEDGAGVLVGVAAKSRAMYENGDIRSPISTRTLVSAAWLVASGMSEADALSYTAFPLFDPDSNGVAGDESDRQKVMGILSMKTGR